MAVRVVRGARLRRAALRSPLPLVVGLYAVAAVAATWPAVRTFGSAFIADGGDGDGEPVAGDHLQAVYRFWLFGHQLGQGGAPWTDPYSFQPLVEPQTVLGQWPFALGFWPLEALFGPVVAWNLLLLGTVFAAGLLTYWWLCALNVGTVGAFAGGLAFALAPYRLTQSGEHLLGWIAVLLPLALLAFERSRAAGSRRSAHGWGALSAAALISIPLSGQLHLALGVVPFVAAYALVRRERVAAGWAAAGLLAATGVGLAIRYTLIRGSTEEGGRSLAEVDEFSAEPLDLLSRWRLDGFEDFVYLGWLTPLLAAVGAVLLWRNGRRGLAVVLAVAAALPPFLALGTNLPVYEAVWRAFPPFRFPRVPGRLLPIADLAIAALAAFAVARAVAAAGRRAAAVGAALVALVAADLAVFPLDASVADHDNRAYSALRTEPEGRVLELPLFDPGVHYGSVYDYYQLQGERERPGGYSTLAPAEAFSFFFTHNRISCGVWLPGDEEALRAAEIEHVLFHRGMYAQGEVPGAWFGWRELGAHGFAPRATGGAVSLFGRGQAAPTAAPVPEPSRFGPVFCEGWEGPEEGWDGRVMIERQAPFWLYGSGTLHLRVSAPAALDAAVWVDGRRVGDARVAREASLETPLTGPGWHAVVLEVPELLDTDRPRALQLDELDLRP
jgi:hypothetical protein